MFRSVTFITAALLLASPAFAAEKHSSHAHKHSVKSSRMHDCASSSVEAYKQSMMLMHHRMNITYTGDADIDFAKGMIPHHQGAVDMALIQLKYGKDEDMRRLAALILWTQRQEIGEMQRWLYVRDAIPYMKWFGVEGDVKGHDHAAMLADMQAQDKDAASTADYKEAMKVMHRDMDIRYSGNPDVDFARGMIPHHQGGIDMAYVQVKHGSNPDMSRLANNIIRAQRAEIAQMQRWLARQGK